MTAPIHRERWWHYYCLFWHTLTKFSNVFMHLPFPSLDFSKWEKYLSLCILEILFLGIKHLWTSTARFKNWLLLLTEENISQGSFKCTHHTDLCLRLLLLYILETVILPSPEHLSWPRNSFTLVILQTMRFQYKGVNVNVHLHRIVICSLNRKHWVHTGDSVGIKGWL